MSGRRFRPHLGWGLVAAAAIAGTIALGQWQLGRADEKAARAAAIESLARSPAREVGRTPLDPVIEHQRLTARGRFEPAHLALLDNRVRRGTAGYEVLMPLRIEGTELRLLVNRGWIAGTGSRERLPVVRTPEGEVRVEGRAQVAGQRIYQLAPTKVENGVWQNVSIERVAAHAGLALQPVVLLQDNDTGDGLVREWPAPDAGVNVHKSYAVQWFALALLILVVYLVLSLRREPDHS